MTELKQLMEVCKGSALVPINFRDTVTKAEEFLLSLPQQAMSVKQFFIDGVYARELTIPTGAVLTGSVHKHSCIVTVSKGHILVATEDGLKEIKAPATFITPPGSKRIAICQEECVWTTYHLYVGEAQPEEEMKQVIGCDTYELYDAWMANWDYELFKREIGLSEKEILDLVQQTHDIIDFDTETAIKVQKSIVEGYGTFTTGVVLAGTLIGKASIGEKRTPLGRFTNHSGFPNVQPVITGGDCIFIALKNLKPGNELLVDYRTTTKIGSSV